MMLFLKITNLFLFAFTFWTIGFFWPVRGADVPVPISQPLTMSKTEKHALRDLIAKSKMSQRRFEQSLLSSAGKGRLE